MTVPRLFDDLVPPDFSDVSGGATTTAPTPGFWDAVKRMAKGQAESIANEVQTGLQQGGPFDALGRVLAPFVTGPAESAYHAIFQPVQGERVNPANYARTGYVPGETPEPGALRITAENTPIAQTPASFRSAALQTAANALALPTGGLAGEAATPLFGKVAGRVIGGMAGGALPGAAYGGDNPGAGALVGGVMGAVLDPLAGAARDAVAPTPAPATAPALPPPDLDTPIAARAVAQLRAGQAAQPGILDQARAALQQQMAAEQAIQSEPPSPISQVLRQAQDAIAQGQTTAAQQMAVEQERAALLARQRQNLGLGRREMPPVSLKDALDQFQRQFQPPPEPPAPPAPPAAPPIEPPPEEPPPEEPPPPAPPEPPAPPAGGGGAPSPAALFDDLIPQPERPRAAPTPREARPALKAMATGAATVARFGHEEQPAHWAVVDADQLVPSHNPVTFQPRPDFPAGAQGRRYETDVNAQASVAQHATGPRIGEMLEQTANTALGPSTISDDGLVVAGHQRVLARLRFGPGADETYRAALGQVSPSLGIDPTTWADQARPTLVRVLDTRPASVEEHARLNTLSDVPVGKAKDLLSDAATRSTALRANPDALEAIAARLEPDETVRQLLDRDGRGVVQSLESAGVIQPGERARFFDPRLGRVSDEGKLLIERMMQMAALPDPAVVARASPSILRKLDRATPALVTVAARPGWSLDRPLLDAVDLATAAHESGYSVAEFTAQADPFRPLWSPQAEKLALVLDRETPTEVTRRVRRYAAIAADVAAHGDGPNLLGEAPHTPGTAFREAFGTEPRAPEAQTPGVAEPPGGYADPEGMLARLERERAWAAGFSPRTRLRTLEGTSVTAGERMRQLDAQIADLRRLARSQGGISAAEMAERARQGETQSAVEAITGSAPTGTSQDRAQQDLFGGGSWTSPEPAPAPELRPGGRATDQGSLFGEPHARLTYGSEAQATDAARLVIADAGGHADVSVNGEPTTASRLRKIRGARRIRAWVDVRGQKLNGVDEIRRFLLPFRSPYVERLHAILLDDQGRVLAHNLESSGAIDYVQVTDRLLKRLLSRAKRTGATKVILAHNHPSGLVEPSDGDRAVTRYVGQELYDRTQGQVQLLGHYIIDHDSGTWLGPGSPQLTEQRFMASRATVGPDWSAEGTTIRSPDQLHRVIGPGAMGHPAVVAFMDTRGIVAVEPHTAEAVSELAPWLEQRMRALGARMVAIAVDETKEPGLYQRAVQAVRRMQAAHASALRHLDDATAKYDELSTEPIVERARKALAKVERPSHVLDVINIGVPTSSAANSLQIGALQRFPTGGRRAHTIYEPAAEAAGEPAAPYGPPLAGPAGGGAPPAGGRSGSVFDRADAAHAALALDASRDAALRGPRPPRVATGPGAGPAAAPATPAQAAERLGGLKDNVLRSLAPQTRTAGAETTGTIIRANSGERARLMAQAYDATRDAATVFDAMPDAGRLDFIHRMETGRSQPTPELSAAANTLRSVLDEWRGRVQALGTGKLQSFIQDYFPHIWKDPDNAKGVILQILSKRSLTGPGGFLKQRTIVTTRDGMAAGLVPVTTNPVDLALLKVREMAKYVEGQREMQELKDRKLAVYVPVGKERPEGYVQLHDKIATVYGPPVVTVQEAFDQLLRDQVHQVLDNFGVVHTRPANIRGRASGLAHGGSAVESQFGSETSVTMHELGHILDHHLQLWDRLNEGKASPVIKRELRALADLRFEGSNPEQSYRKYVRQKPEQVANAVLALVYAPEKMAAVAPTVKARLTEILQSDPRSRPLLDVKPSLVLGTGSTEVPVGGMVVRGHYYAPEPVARVVNNYLSPSLHGQELVDLYRKVGNAMNQVQLGLSAFHLGFTSVDTAVSKAALALEQLAAGRPLEALGSVAQVPAAPITTARLGRRVIRAYYDPASATPEMQGIAKALEMAGGRAKMDDFYRSGAAAGFWQALSDARRTADGMIRAKSGAKAALLSVPAVFEAASKPILEWIVPMQKAGVFADLWRHVASTLPADAPPDVVRAAAAKVWDSVDNRLGEMVYDNLFWHRTLKDAAMASVRSVGWNLGTVRELGGGAADLAHSAIGTVKNGRFVLTHRGAYVVALPFTLGVMGAVVNYLYTGGAARDAKDLFYPRTGRLNPDGTEERVALPSYLKDIMAYGRHPWQTIVNKLHPAVSMTLAMLNNKDYFGNEIRNPDDPLVQQMAQEAKYLTGEMEPFGIQQFRQARSENQPVSRSVGSFVGVTPAPREVVRTPAQTMMRDILSSRLPAGATPEMVAQERLRQRLRLKFEQHDPNAVGDLKAALTSGQLRVTQGEALAEGLAAPQGTGSFKQLRLNEALKVFLVATPAERQKWAPALVTKITRFNPEAYTPQETEDIQQMILALRSQPQRRVGVKPVLAAAGAR